jgi:[acyl-carrier-protein] S-malonyltransferase
MKIAFLFPGQGSQAVGMGRAFAEDSPAATAVWRKADEALGFSLSRLCFEGPEADLALTANTQPAILTASVAAAAVLSERGISPDLCAGHSLGEYSALVVTGALGFVDAIRLVRKRGEFMQEAVPVGTGAMAALMGLDLAAAEQACAEAAQGEVVNVANINSPGQIVIAGHRGAVERAVRAAAALGGRKSVLLPVSAPFHSALMKPAADRLAAELEQVTPKPPRVPVARNVDAGLTTTADDVKPFLVRQVASPVRWTECLHTLAREGATTWLEVGPGRVLTGLLKRTIEGARWHPVEDPESLHKAVAALTGGPTA